MAQLGAAIMPGIATHCTLFHCSNCSDTVGIIDDLSGSAVGVILYHKFTYCLYVQ